jgi:hypothetical protein
MRWHTTVPVVVASVLCSLHRNGLIPMRIHVETPSSLHGVHSTKRKRSGAISSTACGDHCPAVIRRLSVATERRRHMRGAVLSSLSTNTAHVTGDVGAVVLFVAPRPDGSASFTERFRVGSVMVSASWGLARTSRLTRMLERRHRGGG